MIDFNWNVGSIPQSRGLLPSKEVHGYPRLLNTTFWRNTLANKRVFEWTGPKILYRPSNVMLRFNIMEVRGSSWTAFSGNGSSWTISSGYNTDWSVIDLLRQKSISFKFLHVYHGVYTSQHCMSSDKVAINSFSSCFGILKLITILKDL